MTKTLCDYCGKEIKNSETEFTGDLDNRNLAVIRVEPILLNQTDSKIDRPDLCVACIIKTLKNGL